MKKIVLFVVAILLSNTIMAQVQFESDLKSAMEKAKAENKLIMVVGSTTWCGPCKLLYNDVFPTKEAGDYINPKFVSLKYQLDKEDKDSIVKRGIDAYPTMMFLNGDGEEIARIVGGTSDPKFFISRVKEAIEPQNHWSVVNKMYESDPAANFMKYLTHLQKSGKRREAKRLLAENFPKRSVANNFNDESVDYYNENIDNIRNVVVEYMLENPVEVIDVMGEKRFKEFLTVKGNGYLSDGIFLRTFSKSVFENTIKAVGFYELFHSPFYRFINSVKDVYADKKIDVVLEQAYKYMKDADSNSRTKIAKAVLIAAQDDGGKVEVNKKKVAKFLKKCISEEKNDDAKKLLNRQINNLSKVIL